MNFEGEIREAREEDIEDIYQLARTVELTNQSPQVLANTGFLMTSYSQHPEERDFFENCILSQSLFFLHESDGQLLGFVLGYPYWNDTLRDYKVWYTKKLRKVGITDINQLLSKQNFAYLDKIAVHPTYRGKGVFRGLNEHFFKRSKDLGKRYVFLEIIDNVWSEKKSLKIRNKKSTEAYESLGAVKVGRDRSFPFTKSFLGDKGRFSDNVYVVDVTAYFAPRTFHNLPQVISYY
jgi:ribosomal protein S18 acetylase RimI-like enzyme